MKFYFSISRWLLVLCIGYILSIGSVNCQVNPQMEAAARAQLAQRGVTEDELRSKLAEKGIDLNSISPAQLPTIQPAIEQAILEIEAEKNGGSKSNSTETAQPSVPAASNGKTPLNTNTSPVINVPAAITIEPTAEMVEKQKEIGVSIAEKASEQLAEKNIQELAPTEIYGHHLFREKDIAIFRTTNEVKPPDTYALGTGDELTISIFGASSFDSKFTIGKEGYISPSGMQKIFLRGVRLGQAKELIRNRFSQHYKFAPEQFVANLTTARTISVNIFGETNNVGTFTVSAVNTAFNALVAAGGPTELGTVRTIHVIRGGKSKTLDLYAFINNPTIQYDFFLEDNDIIHVPVGEKIVSIQGAVRRPYKYELIDGENWNKLLEYAGGFKADAFHEIIQVKRFENDRQILIDVNLKDLLSGKSDFKLLNGDQVIVKSIASGIENSATIEGPLEYPGVYALAATPRLSDLLKKAVLKLETRKDIGFIARTKTDGTSRLIQFDVGNVLANQLSDADLLLEPKDRVILYAQSRFIDNYTISVGGAVRNDIENFPYSPDSTFTVARAILLAGGLKPDANGSGYIQRTNTTNNKKQVYIEVSLRNALEAPNSPANLVLQPGDRLVALSELSFTDAFQISVGGAVRRPGSFAYGEEMTVRNAIILGGGLSLDAKKMAYIRRKNLKNTNEIQYIEVSLESVLEDPTSGNNSILQPGDELTVLSELAFSENFTIGVSGAVKKPGDIKFGTGMTLRTALILAGGFKLEASKSRIDIFRIIQENDKPTRVFVATTQVDENFNQLNTTNAEIELRPYDEIVVRNTPGFELQQFVSLEGEVKYPGKYALVSDNERLSEVIQRAGGLTQEAFAGGITLYRFEKNRGYIVTDFPDALRSKLSPSNHILKAGDVIKVPKQENLVIIKTANTDADKVAIPELLTAGQISVAFKAGKRAKWYIKRYSGGFADSADRRYVKVIAPSGKINRTRNLGLVRIYPKVVKGALVVVDAKPPKQEKKPTEKSESNIDWDKKLTQILAITSTLATILIASRAF